MTVGLRILGGVAIVVACFWGTLFVFDYFDYDPSGKVDKWQKRFRNGNPVVVHFVCAAEPVFDCIDTYTITYKGIGLGRCEHVFKNGEGQDLTGWCNGHPEENTFSIRGALFSYNRSGEVMRAGKLVGHLSDE
jgi:hypothetical protein